MQFIADKIATLDSSAIERIAYDTQKGDFLVEFRNGGAYVYPDFPEDEYDALLDEDRAPYGSAGSYWGRNLSGSYRSNGRQDDVDVLPRALARVIEGVSVDDESPNPHFDAMGEPLPDDTEWEVGDIAVAKYDDPGNGLVEGKRYRVLEVSKTHTPNPGKFLRVLEVGKDPLLAVGVFSFRFDKEEPEAEPETPTFNVGDRVVKATVQHLIREGAENDFGESEAQKGMGGTVTSTRYGPEDQSTHVRWDNGLTSAIWAGNLELEPAPEPVETKSETPAPTTTIILDFDDENGVNFTRTVEVQGTFTGLEVITNQ